MNVMAPLQVLPAHLSQVAHRPSHLRLAVHPHLALAPVAQVQNPLAHRVPVVLLSVVHPALVHVSQALQALTARARFYGKTEQLRLTGLLAVTLVIALVHLIHLISFGRVGKEGGSMKIILKVLLGWILPVHGIRIIGPILSGSHSQQSVLLLLVVAFLFNRVVVDLIMLHLIRMKQVRLSQ